MATDPSSLYQGYASATRYAGVKDLEKPLMRYRIGLNWFRTAHRKSNDVQLHSMATRGVVKRHLLAKSGKPMPSNYISLSIEGLKNYLKG